MTHTYTYIMLINVIGNTNRKIELSSKIVVISPWYLSKGLHNNESETLSTKYSVPVPIGNGMARIALIIHMKAIIFSALWKLLETFWANIGWQMCSQRSTVNVNIVKTDAIVVTSKTNVRKTQKKLPNFQG
jgi:hypothetical protein